MRLKTDTDVRDDAMARTYRDIAIEEMLQPSKKR